MSNDTEKIRLKRIEKYIFYTMTKLTETRTAHPIKSQDVRDVATRMEAITSNLWKVANDIDHVTDDRPEMCRYRLQSEGKAYPRSGCRVQNCGGVLNPICKKKTRDETNQSG